MFHPKSFKHKHLKIILKQDSSCTMAGINAVKIPSSIIKKFLFTLIDTDTERYNLDFYVLKANLP